MGKTVDERVVQMKFDNRNFENNVKTTMSTLDRLKQSLKFDGASKGLDELDKTAKKMSFNGLSNSIDAVKVKFSALEVMGVTALSNITNSAINAGKRITSAFTIDPIKSGLAEYETQINAVQTILANTSSKGTTIDQVNDALATLNTYADKTIYNFTEMTRNIGTFTAAGIDLDTSVSAIQGIANVAAVSGSTSQQASTAMYQLSQALATGTVKLMDWNSVVNAGMGGQVFQDALTRTSEKLNTGAKAAIKAKGSFRESLSTGWLTSEVLTTTLEQFTMLDNEANRAKLAGMGYAKEQIDEILKMGETATDAATKVKTFSQLMDTLKEAAQSGWTQTWQLIIGDFEEAKAVFTEASDFFGDIINKASNARNELLAGALKNVVSASDWQELEDAGVATKAFQQALIATAETHGIAVSQMIKDEGSFAKTLKKGWLSLDILKETLDTTNSSVSKSTDELSGNLEKFKSLAQEVIKGNWGNGSDRKKALEAAGHDYATVQKVVNNMLLGTKLDLENLSKAELKAMGYTDQQIDSLKELAKTAKKTGTPLNELIEKLERPTGRELLIDTIRNSITAFAKVLGSIRGAWRDIFPAATSEQIYNIIDAVHSFSEALILSDKNADNVKRTFKGLFAILDVVKTIVGGVTRAAFSLLSEVLAGFDLNVLDVTASIGDAAVKFRDWFKANNVLSKGIKATAKGIVYVIKTIKSWIDSFKEIPGVKRNIESFTKIFTNMFGGASDRMDETTTRFGEFVNRVKELDGLTLDNVKTAIKDFKDNVVGYLFDIDESFLDAQTTFSSFKSNVKASLATPDTAFGDFLTGVKAFGEKIKDILSNIDVGGILTIAVGIGMIKGMKKLSGALDMFSNPLENISGALEAFSNNMNAGATEKKASAMLKMAESIAVLAAALFIISKIDKDRLLTSVGVIVALGAAMTAFAAINSKMNKKVGSVISASTIVGLSVALLIMISALKKLEKLDPERIQRNMVYLGEIATGLLIASVVLGKANKSMGKGKGTVNLIAFAASLKILVGVLKAIDEMDLQNGNKTIITMIGLVGTLIAASKLTSGGSLQSGLGLLAIAISLKVLVSAFKKIDKLKPAVIAKGLIAVAAIFTAYGLLIKASSMSGANSTKAGLMILAMAASLILIAAACKKLSKIDSAGLAQATIAIGALLTIFGLVTALSRLAGDNATKAGAMILMMSGAFLALSITITILSKLDPDGLDRAVTAISKIMACFGLLIVATKFATDVKDTLIVLSVAIGILAVALGTLSLIKPAQLKSATNAISQVVIMFGVLVASTSLAKSATGSLVALTVAVGMLSTMLILVAQLPAGSAMGAAAALSVLLLSLSAAMLILSNTKTISPTALLGLGAMVVIVGMLGGMLAVLSAFDVSVSIETASALSILLLSMSGACLILSAVGGTAPAALLGALALAGVIAILGTVIAAMGALVDNVKGLDSALDKGVDVFVKIGNAIGGLLGGIVGGFAAGTLSGLPKMGTYLTEFMENASGFFDGLKGIDSNVATSAKSLADVALAITGTGVINKLSKVFLGSDSFDGLAKNLESFAKAIVAFSDTVKTGNIDAAAVQVAADAGAVLQKLESSLSKNSGFIGYWSGAQDLGTFAKNIVQYGKAIVEFNDVVSKGNIDTASIQTAADAGAILVALESSLAKTEGVSAWWNGTTDLGTFGKNLLTYGKAIADFMNVVSDANINTAAVQVAADAGSILAALEKSLSKTSGIGGWWKGNTDIGKFGKNLVVYGQAVADFTKALGDVDVDSKKIEYAANAGKVLSEVEQSLGDGKGVLSIFSGKQDLKDFGEKLILFGEGIAGFSNSVEDIDEYTLRTVKNHLESIVEMSEFIQQNSNFQFVRTFGELAQAGVNSLIDGFNDNMGTVEIAVGNFTHAALAALQKQYPRFTEAGNNVIDGFLDGIQTRLNSGDVWAAGTSIGKTALIAAKQSLDIHSPSREMYKVGTFTIAGFVNALQNGTKTVTETATSLFSGFVTQATKASKVSEYGKGIISSYASNYLSKTKDITKQTNKASKALSIYVDKLYKESDAYKEDKANVKAHTKELNNLYKQRVELQKKLANTSKLTKEGKTNSEYTNLQKQLSDVNTQITATKKKLVKDGNDIQKHAQQLLADIKKSIKNAVSDYANFFNLSLGTGIDLFEKVGDAAESAADAAKKAKQEAHDSLVSLLKDYANIFSLSKDAGIKLFEAFNQNGADAQRESAVTQAKADLEESTNNVTEATQNLKDAEDALAAAQAKSNAVNGRSQRLLDEVANATQAVKEAQEALTQATEAQTMAQTALDESQKDTSVEDLLKNMESQIKGVKELNKDLQDLGKRGLSEGLMQYLKSLGTDGVDQVKTFVKMTDEELKKADKLFAQSNKLNAATLINDFKDKVGAMTEWSNNIKLFTKLNLSDNVKADLLKQFQEKGVDSADYLNAILGMSSSQLKDFNKQYQQYLKVPEEVATQVMKNTSKYVKDESENASTAVDEMLENMYDNVQRFNEWQKNLKKLAKTNISDALLAELTSLGIDGADKVKTFTEMTAAEIKKANSLFAEAGKQSADAILTNFQSKLTDAKTWGDNVLKLSKLNLSDKVKEALLAEVQEQGMSSADYVSAILGMDDKQLKEFNKQYKEYLKIPTSVADEILAAQIKVSSDVDKKTADSGSTIVENLKVETEKANTQAKKSGKEIGTTLAKSMTSGMSEGITNGSKQVTKSASTTGQSALTALKDSLSTSTGKSVGSNVTSGIVKGLTDGANSVKEAATTVALDALKSAKKALGIKSPSREFMKVGMYSMAGMANGLRKYAGDVSDASTDVGNTALNAMSSSIARISQLTEDNLDVTPTIRPVLDLTDVENGVGRMNGLFANNMVGVNSSSLATGISNRMNAKSNPQNGNTTTYDDNSSVVIQNTFNISGGDPKQNAVEISKILQKQVNRKDAIWA